MVVPARVAVVGAGLMGHAIAWVMAAAGHPVRVHDPVEAARDELADRLCAIDALMRRPRRAPVTVHDRLADIATDADLVIEAAPEDAALKQDILADLEGLVPAGCVLATNTSSISLSVIGMRMRDPSRLVGAHFWNPPHLVRLVEVVQGPTSRPEMVEWLIALLQGVGHHPVHILKDIPGIVGNRLQHALKREAIALVAEGVCSAETVDDVVKLGFGQRLAVLGPLEQSDLVGLDLTLAIHRTLMADLDVTPGPHPLLERLVAEGKTGMAAGEGFREWTPEQAERVRQRLAEALRSAPPPAADRSV